MVVSTAIPEDNPELSAARAAGARVLHRADLLGELSRMKRTIAVSGTHGKTTTASMATHVLRATGRDRSTPRPPDFQVKADPAISTKYGNVIVGPPR